MARATLSNAASIALPHSADHRTSPPDASSGPFALRRNSSAICMRSKSPPTHTLRTAASRPPSLSSAVMPAVFIASMR